MRYLFLLFFTPTLLSLALSQGFFPCHPSKPIYNTDVTCTRVELPPQLCKSCPLRPPDSQGRFEQCDRIFDTESAQCHQSLQQYVQLNAHCDPVRTDAVPKMIAGDSDATKVVDYFLYSVCEQCCDCIPMGSEKEDYIPLAQSHTRDNPTLWAEDRGNCPAHAHFDVCKVLPHVTYFAQPGDPARDDAPRACPMLRDWLHSGESSEWESNPRTNIDPDLRLFLKSLLDTVDCENFSIWGKCYDLENLQNHLELPDDFVPPPEDEDDADPDEQVVTEAPATTLTTTSDTEQATTETTTQTTTESTTDTTTESTIESVTESTTESTTGATTESTTESTTGTTAEVTEITTTTTPTTLVSTTYNTESDVTAATGATVSNTSTVSSSTEEEPSTSTTTSTTSSTEGTTTTESTTSTAMQTPAPEMGENAATGSPLGSGAESEVEGSEEAVRGSSCFPGDATVELQSGKRIRMAELRIGDVVRVGQEEFSPVFMFSHRSKRTRVERYVQLKVGEGKEVTMTERHMVRVQEKGYIGGGSIEIGDLVESVQGWEQVKEVAWVDGWGLYSPQTVHGEIVVDGVVCSTWSEEVGGSMGVGLMAPVRWLFGIGAVEESTFGGVLSEGGRGMWRMMVREKMYTS